MSETTEDFFSKSKKEERIAKRLKIREKRAEGRGRKKDAKKGITPEQRQKLNEAELAKKEAELVQDQAVASIAQSLPSESPTTPKNNVMFWFILMLVFLVLIAVLIFFIL
jgi:hypothetical protein